MACGFIDRLRPGGQDFSEVVTMVAAAKNHAKTSIAANLVTHHKIHMNCSKRPPLQDLRGSFIRL